MIKKPSRYLQSKKAWIIGLCVQEKEMWPNVTGISSGVTYDRDGEDGDKPQQSYT